MEVGHCHLDHLHQQRQLSCGSAQACVLYGGARVCNARKQTSSIDGRRQYFYYISHQPEVLLTLCHGA